MKILLDHGAPAPLRNELPAHNVETAFERGWSELRNGDLLREAESIFDLLITTDQNLKYQQNLSGRRIAILVLNTTSWPRIKRSAADVRAAVDAILPGAFVELAIAS